MDESREICPGCSWMYSGTCNIARIIPGCSHSLCQKCIVTDGTNTGRVKCRSPGCLTSVRWTNRQDQFLPNMFILGTETYRQHCLSAATVHGKSVDVLENVNDEIVDEATDDEHCDVMCGECEESTADCLCQSCHSSLCSNCFDKIHKMAKSLMNHKSLPIVTDYDGQKMEQQVKLSNCAHHGKKIEYVAEGGDMGCAQCVIYGKMKGLDPTTLVTYNKNMRKDLREKIDEGKSKVERLKSVLSGLKSERAIQEDILPEDLTKQIKCHFSECHTHLQTLEHQLCQKLEEHQIELTTWQRDIDVLIKSTSSKIDEVTKVLKFSEEVVSNDAVLDIFNFNEIIRLLPVNDETSEAIEQTRPDSYNLAIEPGFKHHLMSHITLNKSDLSLVSHPTGASSPLASSTLLAPDYSGSSSSPKMASPVISSTCMTFDSAGSSPPPQMASLVSESELIPPSPLETDLTVAAEMGHQEINIILQNEEINRGEKVSEQEVQQLENISRQDVQRPENVLLTSSTTTEFSTGSSPPPHMESELPPSPPSPKVSQQLEKVSQREVQQLENVSQREIQQLENISQQDVQQPENVLLTSTTTEFSTGSSPPPHMESELPPSPPSPKVSQQLEKVSQREVQQLEKVSQREVQQLENVSREVQQLEHVSQQEVQQPENVLLISSTTTQFSTGSSPPPHMESELPPSPQLEIQQPQKDLQPEIQQPLQVSQQQLQQQQHLSPDISTASSPFSLEHPLPSAQTVCISYQDGNKSTRCIDIEELQPEWTCILRPKRLFPVYCVEAYEKDEKMSASKKEKLQKSARGRDSVVLSKSCGKSPTINVRRNLIEKNLHQKKIVKVKEGESQQSSHLDWNSVLKKSIQKIRAQKQAANMKRIYQQVTRTHRNLKPISDDIVEKKLDVAVKKGLLERIVKDEKVTFRVTRRPQVSQLEIQQPETVLQQEIQQPLQASQQQLQQQQHLSPDISTASSPWSDINGAGLNVSALCELDSNDFGAVVGLCGVSQEKVNV